MTDQDLGRREPGRNTGWPFGHGHLPYDELSNHLHKVGKRHARRALSEYVVEDDFDSLDAAYSVGTSVELLAKSLLASVAPALLLSGAGDTHSILKFAGSARLAQGSAGMSSVKSLEATNCIGRLRQLGMLPDPWPDTDSHIVFGVRNVAAHMGLVDRRQLNASIGPMVRFSEHVREYYGQSSEEWWTAEYTRIAAKMLDDEMSEWQRVVHTKIAAAKERVRRRREKLGASPEMAETIFKSQEMQHPPVFGEYGEQVTCPSCGYGGWAIGASSASEMPSWFWPAEIERTRPDDGETHAGFFFISGFSCNICELKLVGAAEVKAAGLSTSFSDFNEHKG